MSNNSRPIVLTLLIFALPTAMVFSDHDKNLGIAIAVAVVNAAYFFPMIVAWYRNHDQFMAIGVLNLFTGWTFIGWIAALVWSCTSPLRRYRLEDQSSS